MTRYSFIRTIVEDPDRPGEMILDLGEEICEHLDWHEGDELEWKNLGDGSWSLSKKVSKSDE